MNRRTILKAMLGSGLGILGCKEKLLQVANEPDIPKKSCIWMDLFKPIAMVETSCPFDVNYYETTEYDQIKGLAGELGRYQLTKQYVDDVNRIVGIHSVKWFAGRKWWYEDRVIPMYCRKMMRIYWEHYCTQERLGRMPVLQDLIRCHNGGPDGWRDDPGWFVRNRKYSFGRAKDKITNTKIYWAKVKMKCNTYY